MKTTFAPTEFAGAAERLSRLLNAFARIHQDVEMLPEGLSTEEREAREVTTMDSVLGEFAIPRDVWSEETNEFSPKDVKFMTRGMRKWCAGRMCFEEVSEFMAYIDEQADLDWGYIFLGVPLRRLADEDPNEVDAEILSYGSRRNAF